MTVALDRVSFAYPGSQSGISDVSFSIEPGELLAVIGPSGCGKTTILKLVAGFLQPDSGRILLAGRDATSVPTRARELGIVFQNYALFPHMSAVQNIAYPLKLRSVAAAEREARASEALSMVGLAGFEGRRPNEMSGGQQQRVALARALVFRPKALLLDEPLSALDASRRLEMRDEIRRLQQAHGIATLHITHDQEEALSMADRVAVMMQGRLLQVATPHELYERPASRGVAAFVGHANLWDGLVLDDTRIGCLVGDLRCAPLGLPRGTPVSVLVRPERVRLGSAPDGVNDLSGTVSRDRYLGSFRRYDLAVKNGVITIETGAAQPAATVHVPPEAVQVLASDRLSPP